MSLGTRFMIGFLTCLVALTIGLSAVAAVFDTGPFAWLNPDSFGTLLVGSVLGALIFNSDINPYVKN